MRLTFLQIVNEILLHAGSSKTETLSGTPDPTTERVMNAVNMASENLCRVHEWNFLRTNGTVTTTSGSRQLLLTNITTGNLLNYDIYRSPIRLYYTSGGLQEIREATLEEWNSYTLISTPTSGNPLRYIRNGIVLSGSNFALDIQLDPRPSSAITVNVDYRLLLPRRTASTDTFIWPDQALIMEAKRIYFGMRGRNSDDARRDILEALADLKSIDGTTPDVAVGRGRVGGHGWDPLSQTARIVR